MNDIAEIVVKKWQNIIESIEVDGYKNKIERIDLFRMDKYYTGYPEIEYCYKVNFNFGLGDIRITDKEINLKSSWSAELTKTFLEIFSDDNSIKLNQEELELNIKNWNETVFNNDKVEYMTNQGHRFIVQFYPLGYLTEIRNEKLNKLLNED